jgi:hypothetical protein
MLRVAIRIRIIILFENLKNHQDNRHNQNYYHKNGKVAITSCNYFDEVEHGGLIGSINEQQYDNGYDGDAQHFGQDYGEGMGVVEQNRGQQGIYKGGDICAHDIGNDVFAPDKATLAEGNKNTQLDADGH